VPLAVRLDESGRPDDRRPHRPRIRAVPGVHAS
jgi:hypothetical protein